jgi:23S rRNA (uridine2552-2'-O)-methyltransferase
LSGRWKQERYRDQFYRLAKERGYRSRSAFKLLQMVRKYRFMKYGDVVVDLGAAPGGWLQVCRQTVGKKGFVLGVDMDPIPEFPWAYVKTLVEDITSESLPSKILDLVASEIDVVISDVSPNISGAWDVDHAKQLRLAERSFEIARKVLKRRGNFLCKLFHGSDLKAYENSVAECFEEVRLVKPPASKQRSSEIYLLALHFRG